MKYAKAKLDQVGPHQGARTMTMTQVLYNNSYGDGFSFSNAFADEYARRLGKKFDTTKALFWKGRGSVRCDPVAIALFLEKGSEWSSGPTASLELREFSSVFENYWEIEEQDGDEYVRVRVTDALADILHAFVASGDRAALDQQYKAIMEGAKTLSESLYELAAAPETRAELKKEADTVVTHVGHTYFGTEPETIIKSEIDLGYA